MRLTAILPVAVFAAAAVAGPATTASAAPAAKPAKPPVVVEIPKPHANAKTGPTPKLVGVCTATTPGAKIVDMRIFVDGGLRAYYGGYPFPNKPNKFWYTPGVAGPFDYSHLTPAEAAPLTAGAHRMDVVCVDNAFGTIAGNAVSFTVKAPKR